MENINNNKTIAIIGGGVAGLLSAKYSKENGIVPTVFEKGPEIGGIWSEAGHSWPNMQSNVSKYTDQFSDHYWKEEDQLFIPRSKMHEWLEEYTSKFNFKEKIKLRCEVLLCKLTQEDKVEVSWNDLNQNTKSTEVFDYLIVASGNFQKQNLITCEKYLIDPELKNTLDLEIIHSSNYEGPEKFLNKNVLVVGNSHSGLQLSDEISKQAKSTTNLFRNRQWILPKYLYADKYKKVVPIDLIGFGTREDYMAINEFDQTTKNSVFNQLFSTLSEQNNFSELYINKDSTEPKGTGITLDYLSQVQKGFIKPIEADIIDLKGKIVTLSNGEELVDIDVIVLATGYQISLPFLDRDILEVVEFNSQNNKFGFQLNLNGHNVYTTKIKSIAFVGFQYSSVFTTFELQARLAIKYFSNQINDVIAKTIVNNNHKVAYYDYTEYLAEIIGCNPDLDFIKEKDEELYNYLLKGMFLPQHYALGEFNSDSWNCNAALIKKWNRMFNSEYLKFDFN